MNNQKIEPRKLPLILILIGTTILAFPAAFGTWALFDKSMPGGASNDRFGSALFCISISGFALFAGYILTAIFRRGSSIFWLLSAIYNIGLSLCYLYILFSSFPVSRSLGVENLLLLLMPAWTIFVAASSIYYFKSALPAKKSELP